MVSGGVYIKVKMENRLYVHEKNSLKFILVVDPNLKGFYLLIRFDLFCGFGDAVAVGMLIPLPNVVAITMLRRLTHAVQ